MALSDVAMGGYPTVEVGWPFVVLTITLLVRDELRFYRLHGQATAVRQAVSDSTMVVRRGDRQPWDSRDSGPERRRDDEQQT